jgi:polysaccharide export outer membrane protein
MVTNNLKTRRAAAFILFALALGVRAAYSQAAPTNYIVGPQDILTITVFDQEDLSGKYPVDADGSFTFPLIGRVQAGGKTLRQLEADLKKKLVDEAIFKDPQLAVAVDSYKSQKIHMVGEVRNPGTYPLTGDMSLIEAIARAGSTLPTASGEALIVRSKGGDTSAPVMPNGETTDFTTVDLKELQKGAVSMNIALRDGDTIFVPRAETVYVFGQVKNPGAYPIQRSTTVLQALSMAGGITDRGATGRIRVVRIENGKTIEVRVKLTDLVRAGDTIMVPERFF